MNIVHPQVLVVGAGASGIPAAIAAARAGAQVLLVEEDPVIGGAPSDYFVTMFCGGPLSGILKEAETLLKAHYSPTPEAYFFLPEGFQAAFHTLIAREPNLTVMAGARVVAVLRTGDAVTGVCVAGRDGAPLPIYSEIVVDATGSGAVAALAGCPTLYGREARAQFGEPHAPEQADTQVQDCTWMYISQQIGGGTPFDMLQLDHVRLGVLVNGLGWYHSDPERAQALNPGIYLHWGCKVHCADTRDPLARAAAQLEARRLMERDHALLRAHGYAIHLAPQLGVRESARVLGMTVITENDLRSGQLPADTIAVGTYELDFWGADQHVPVAERATPGYGIPYRALVPQATDGLLLAGRCISGTHIAMSAYRVMPIAGSIGQAAGVAAALCVRQHCRPRDLDAQAVRTELRSPRQNQQLDL